MDRRICAWNTLSPAMMVGGELAVVSDNEYAAQLSAPSHRVDCVDEFNFNTLGCVIDDQSFGM